MASSARAGIHAGEVELQGDEVRGIAVHAAARILDVSRPGEGLVSATVRDLLSGSGLKFADRGEFECAASTAAAAWRRRFARAFAAHNSQNLTPAEPTTPGLRVNRIKTRRLE
jgi:class 3 adenylate cyclase